jgi:ketosteroid isomerase-like protein
VSRENVDIVRGVWPEALDVVQFLRDGAPFPSDLGARVHPDTEVEFLTGSPGTPPLRYRGLDGFIEGWSDWVSPFDRYELELQDYLDAGDDVVVLTHVRARTHRDGVLVEHDPAGVFTVRDGLIVHVRFFLEREAALDAAGLAH